MTHELHLNLYRADDSVQETECLAFSLEREAYVPYETVTATFLSHGGDYSNLKRIGISFDNTEIFLGLADNVRQYTRNQVSFVRIVSRSFTSVLTQNELIPGLHSNLTVESLLTGFYTFPHITYENLSGSDYIFVKTGNTMWDGVVSFGYKLTGHYPYTVNNCLHFSAPSGQTVRTYSDGHVLEYGTCLDSIRLVSHYHMEDINGNADAYRKENLSATALEIVRHRQIAFDRGFLSDPDDALIYRNLYSERGCRANYLVYDDFQNEVVGERATFGTLMSAETICRVQATFGSQGFRTKLWCYHDGFYNHT